VGAFENIGNSGQVSCERRFEQLIGNSPALEAVLEQVERVAPTGSTVLIQGETGTGKELIARAIHNISSRCGRSFVKLNCAAIPLDLLESELFGHERGAFTGAIAQRIGRFELADQGTLFLDEVGDIPLALQPKLLRVLQEQEFERLGSTRTHQVDVRLVAATNRDLTEMVKRGEFRSDLYYRLNVFPILLPPLRARREDIRALVTHFIEIFGRRTGRQIKHISSGNNGCAKLVSVAGKYPRTTEPDRTCRNPFKLWRSSQSLSIGRPPGCHPVSCSNYSEGLRTQYDSGPGSNGTANRLKLISLEIQAFI
jgi:formate hydrogenlyase transcriptional activator